MKLAPAMRLGAALLLLLLLPGAEPAAGRELWRQGERALDFTGSLRQIVLATGGTDLDAFRDAALADPGCLFPASFPDCRAFERVNDRDVWQSLTRLRVRFDLALGSGLSAVLAYDHELRGGILGTLGDGLSSGLEPESFLGLEREIHVLGLREGDDHFRWSHRVYRGALQYESDRLSLSLGRQRIAWGVGRLWNPIDRFNAIAPLAIEADESQGVDALDLRWRWSGFSYIQLVHAPGPRRDDASTALRLHGVLRDVDYSLVAGVFEDAPTFGIDLDRNLGDSAVRLEAVYTHPNRDVWSVGRAEPEKLPAYWQVVASLDHNIDVGNGVYVLLEHLYNENALGFGGGRAGILLPFFESQAGPLPGTATVGPASRDVFGASRVVTSARNLTGFQVSTELSTALRGDVLLLYDWSGRSAALAPQLVFDGWDAAQLSLGAQLFSGPRRSQFGDSKAILFLIGEWFF